MKSKFKSVHSCLDPNAAKSVNARNKMYVKLLPELANDFVHIQLKVAFDDLQLFHRSYLMDKALA
jgi:hypothetical protein